MSPEKEILPSAGSHDNDNLKMSQVVLLCLNLYKHNPPIGNNSDCPLRGKLHTCDMVTQELLLKKEKVISY